MTATFHHETYTSVAVQGPKGARRSKGETEDAAYDFKDRINFSVFPSLQGGPHNHQVRFHYRVERAKGRAEEVLLVDKRTLARVIRTVGLHTCLVCCRYLLTCLLCLCKHAKVPASGRWEQGMTGNVLIVHKCALLPLRAVCGCGTDCSAGSGAQVRRFARVQGVCQAGVSLERTANFSLVYIQRECQAWAVHDGVYMKFKAIHEDF